MTLLLARLASPLEILKVSFSSEILLFYNQAEMTILIFLVWQDAKKENEIKNKFKKFMMKFSTEPRLFNPCL